jgi:Fur family transcriptional regulator, ferric uptake regulator
VILTTQRRAMIDELRKLNTHPTADEFYQVIRKKIPKVSMASVYRNLEVLSSAGHIVKLDNGGTKMRFDGDLSRHYHLRCSECGRLVDFMPKGADCLEKSLRNMKKLNVDLIDINIEFTGKCSKCD